MNRVIINAQKGDSIVLNIARKIANDLGKDDKTTEYTLPYDLLFDEKKGGKEKVYETLDEAEVFLIAVPDYSYNEIGSIKAFLDAYFLRLNLEVPERTYKQAVIISSRKTKRAESWHKEIYSASVEWGMKLTYRLSFNFADMKYEELGEKDLKYIDKRIKKIVKLLLKNNGKIKASNYFSCLLFSWHSKVHSHAITTSIKHWIKKGWVKVKNDA